MSQKRYWFPAKTYGWGWGFPSTWQGWVVLCLYLAGVALVIAFVHPDDRPVEFFACIGVLTAALVAVCWITGEPPKWRWGRK